MIFLTKLLIKKDDRNKLNAKFGRYYGRLVSEHNPNITFSQ